MKKKNNNSGYLVAIEGNDGTGKSTQIKLLKKYLKSRNKKVIVARYNMSYITLPAIKEGKKRRFSPEINTYLHFLSIIDQFDQYINRYLNKGYTVIFDRYIYSVLARGLARGVNSDIINFLYHRCVKPDLIVLLDIDPSISIKRLKGNINYWEAGCDVLNEENLEQSFLKFQQITRRHLKELIKKEENYQIINSNHYKKDIFFKIIKTLNNDNNGC
ncbi:dTMP kinase [Staphylococcus kloosii]|uniref:dTMP kinase n=1 Tax=Staphylococcus kloosii TaxID=29384 RepID=UPI0028A40141|nr:dTMP kinase [Staphylococcus kloosii]MDT3959793.1 dTMP kinase [Staphylococcus kloosii]